MQIVLLAVAIISIVVLQDFATGIFIIGLTVLNAVLGLNQEGKAAESVAALRKMLIIKAKARRNGELVELPAEELVPGDIITFEAGDKVSADGRLLTAAALDIEEAGLTGESAPVTKDTTPIAGDDVPLGDRLDMAYMNSTVTRGRGEMVVTGTGMNTEVGQISNMLNQTEEEKTPLTKQLDQLTVMITAAAGVALVLVVVLGLARGQSFDSLFLMGISLAIAAIPTGMPAVVTTLLSLGTQQLAEKGAIIKRLRVGRDPRLDLGDLLRQDRNADPESDDGPRARPRRTTLLGRWGRVLNRGADPAGRRRGRPAVRADPHADGALQRRDGHRRADRR